MQFNIIFKTIFEYIQKKFQIQIRFVSTEKNYAHRLACILLLFVFYLIVTVDNDPELCGTHVILHGYFYMSNGLKQGIVLSAILFTIYIHRLLISLRDSRFGCKINNCYIGAISHDDDITLSCTSICGLNRMLDICSKFAAEHYLVR